MRYTTRLHNALLVVLGSAALAATPAEAGLFGSPKFTMSQSDDRFSADGRTVYSSDGNRISKRSIAGGTHIDRGGVYLNPMAVFDRTTGELTLLSLSFVNITERMSGLGEPNAIGRPVRVSFITGEGEPIVLPITSAERRYGEVRCSPYVAGCNTPLLESGIATIRPEDYRRLMAATALAVKVDGSDRSHIYETRDIATTFIPNLRTFYERYLAAAQ